LASLNSYLKLAAIVMGATLLVYTGPFVSGQIGPRLRRMNTAALIPGLIVLLRLERMTYALRVGLPILDWFEIAWLKRSLGGIMKASHAD
jgi:hypothetical protein